MDEIAPGIWRWACPHPQWSPGAFGAEVASYAVVTEGELLLVDPLLPADAAPVLERLDALAAGRSVHVLITLEYHVRSAEPLAGRLDATLHGPEAVRGRLEDPGRLEVWTPGEPGPGGVVASFEPGGETPLWFPSHAALVFGDLIVTTPDGELRVWKQEPLDPGLLPALEPLGALPAEHVLTTHGPPVIGGGAAALRTALATPPWEFQD